MPDREKVKYDIERCICHVPDACRDCSHYQDDRFDCIEKLLADTLALLQEQEYKVRMYHALEEDWKRLKAMLKEQEEERKRMLFWLGKFCRHIDNGDKWLTDEENIAFFREKMKQQFGWFCAEGEVRMKEYIMIKEIGNAPITVAELVRCKDCLKRGSYEKCPIGGASERSIYDNWFCADGERQEGR